MCSRKGFQKIRREFHEAKIGADEVLKVVKERRLMLLR